MLRIDINDPNFILDDMPTSWGAGVFRYNGELFTGIAFAYFPGTSNFSDESEFREGIAEGRQVEYWPNGIMREEHNEKYGKLIGTCKEWNEQGILTSHQEYDDNGNFLRIII